MTPPQWRSILEQIVRDELEKMGVGHDDAKRKAVDLVNMAQSHAGRRMFAMLAHQKNGP